MINDVFSDRHQKLALDLGCGQGGMMQKMAATCVQVIGLENNFYLASLANQLLKAESIETRVFDPVHGWKTVQVKKPVADNAQVVCANMLHLPFHEPLFDWVHCGHALDLVDDPEDVIHRVMRILKPGGRLSLSTPWV